mgnify:CR=1 FL=1
MKFMKLNKLKRWTKIDKWQRKTNIIYESVEARSMLALKKFVKSALLS